MSNDPRSYFFCLINNNNWVFIAMNGTHNENSLIRLEKWKTNNSKIYTLNRCSYTNISANASMQAYMMDPSYTMGPDLYAIVEHETAEIVAIIWHPINMPHNIEMVYKKSKSIILDKKCSLDRIREIFTMMLAEEELETVHNIDMRIVQSSSQRNNFWHVLI